MKSLNLNFNYLPVLAILLSSSTWGLIWYPSRYVEQQGMSIVWATFIVFLLMAMLLLPTLIKTIKSTPNLLTKRLIGLGLAAGLSNICFLVALIEGEIMRVMLLFYLSPIWTVLIGRYWLGERLTQGALMMLVLAIVGMLSMLWQPDSGLPWPEGLGDWLALFASFMFSLHNVQARSLGAISELIKTSAIAFGVVIVALLVIIFKPVAISTVPLPMWFMVALIGCLVMGVATLSVLYGLARMPVNRSSVLMLFELVVAAVSAWALTDERLSLAEWIGGLMILAAGAGLLIQKKH